MRASDALAETIWSCRKQSQAMRSFLSSAETRGPRPKFSVGRATSIKESKTVWASKLPRAIRDA